MEDGNGKMQRPIFRYEVNLNTVIQIITIVGVVWAISSQSTRMEEGQKQNREAIQQIKADISELKISTSAISALQFRVTALENSQAILMSNQKDFEKTVSGLASDMRLTREIVQRLDRRINPGN